MTKEQWAKYKADQLARKGRKIWSNPANTPEMKAKYNGATWPDLSPGEVLPAMTKQEFKMECDINTIVNQYLKTGDAELLGVAQKYYGDVSHLPKDFHEALNQVQTAQAAFDALPAKLRQAFNHDAGALLDFVKNPDNYDKASEMGLVPKKEKPAPKPTPKAETPPGQATGTPPAPKP